MAKQPRKQIKSPMAKFTLADMQRKYPDEKTCLEWLFRNQYPDGITCPKCGVINAKYHYVASRKSFSCQWCGHHVSPTAGTIFDHSSTPLTKWFYAIYLMAQTRTGISAKQLQRELGVTYKTAWRMFKMIRGRLDEGGDAFGGDNSDVEVDETYVGGPRRGKRGRGAANKTPVVGAVERGGRVKAKVVPNTQAKTVLPFVYETVSRAAIVHTDEYQIYDDLVNRGYEHYRVPHGEGVFVIDNTYTNSIDGFWAQVKNAVNGVHHGVSPLYLQRYVNEYAFRYSHRNDVTPMFYSFLRQAATKLDG
jgi:transposase-like protein